jgi:hypothetical protein
MAALGAESITGSCPEPSDYMPPRRGTFRILYLEHSPGFSRRFRLDVAQVAWNSLSPAIIRDFGGDVSPGEPPMKPPAMPTKKSLSHPKIRSHHNRQAQTLAGILSGQGMCLCRYERNIARKFRRSWQVCSAQRTLPAIDRDSRTCAKPKMPVWTGLRTAWKKFLLRDGANSHCPLGTAISADVVFGFTWQGICTFESAPFAVFSYALQGRRRLISFANTFWAMSAFSMI